MKHLSFSVISSSLVVLVKLCIRDTVCRDGLYQARDEKESFALISGSMKLSEKEIITELASGVSCVSIL